MKAMSLLKWGLLLAASLSFFACSDDNDGEDGNGGNTQPIESVHYDVWVGLEQNNMGHFKTLLVKNTNSLEGTETIDFKNQGCDVTSTFGNNESSIVKGKYYYQVDGVNVDRFVKYQILNGQLTRIQEQPFERNTYKKGSYTHAWVGDTLVILAANGEKDKVIWTKLDSKDLRILSEGELDLSESDVTKFTSSGLARYRQSDHTIIYTFKQYTKKMPNPPLYFFAAFVDATSMQVKKIVKEDRAHEMAGSAFGELRQHKMFFDENENLYIACNSRIEGSEDETCQYGSLLRIKAGETDFDKTYNGFEGKEGKLITVDYMGDNKALVYIQDPEHTGTSTDNKLYEGWGNHYNCYYAMLDLNNQTLTEFEHQGVKLPYSSGTFSQRSFVLNNKAFIGVNPEHSQPQVYVYDIQTDSVEKGVSIQEGYIFTRIVYITD